MPSNLKKADMLRIFTLILFFFILIYLFLFIFIPKFVPQELYIGTPSKNINILVLGLDYSYDEKHNIIHKGRADTLMVCHINPILKKTSILSIPRDTLINIPGYGPNKINSAFVLGKIKLTKETVENYIGVKINKYVLIEPNGLAQFVNAIGGIKINIENDMVYKDNWGHLNINLKKGFFKLNGEQAQGYVRFRHDALGDISRIKRQHIFLNALFKKLASPAALIRSPWIMISAKKAFKTDLSFYDILKIGNLMRLSNKENIVFRTLPGNFSQDKTLAGYWIPLNENKIEVLKELNILE